MLYIVCTVCTEPKAIVKELERYLMFSSHVQCAICKQYSEVPKSLKNLLRTERGMNKID